MFYFRIGSLVRTQPFSTTGKRQY